MNLFKFSQPRFLMAPEGEASSSVATYADADAGTFDDFDDESDASFEAKIAKMTKEEEKEETPAPKKEKKSELLDLDDEDDSEEEKEEKPKKSEKKEEKKEEEEKDPEEEKEEDKEKEEKAEKNKKIKIRTGDGLYGVEADSSVRVKVDGQYQDVPIQELINNYSGKTAWDKKFTEIGQEKKAIETQKNEVGKTVEFLKTTLNDVLKPIQDENANPLEALYYLVDKSGGDTYSVYKRMLEANLAEVERLLDMSETERKLFWAEKKDEFRSKREQALQEATKKEQSFNQAVQKVDQLRQAHGVSEEQFLNALDELESQGYESSKLTDEQVVDYASLKPHVESVQDVLQPYEDEIEDSRYSEIVQALARQLRAKDFTVEQLSEWAKKEFADEDLLDLSSRVPASAKKEKVEEKIHTYLTLDDED